MQHYVIRRLLQLVPVVILVSIVMFVAMRMIPGGPGAVYARGQVSPEAQAAIRQKLGLDEPIWVQYWNWVVPAVQGDLGYSANSGRPVLQEVADRIPPTLYLMGSTFLVVLVLSILAGTYSALRQYSKRDIAFTTISFAGAALPVFWLGLMLIIVNGMIINPATGRPFLPTGGMVTAGREPTIPDLLVHLILPLIALAVGWVSWYSRYVRASMLDVIHQDYIRTARAAGLRERRVIFRHAFKNAALPLVTVIALDLPFLFAGALYVEVIFGWPGMGRLFYDSTLRRDYPVMIGVVVIIAVLVILGNLLADIAYTRLDPRVRYGRR